MDFYASPCLFHSSLKTLGKHMLKTPVEQQQGNHHQKWSFIYENAIQITTISEHQKLFILTRQLTVATLPLLPCHFSKWINILWPDHLFSRCFSCLTFSHMVTYTDIVSGAKGQYIVSLFREPYLLVWLLLSKWYHWLCKYWFSMLPWSWHGRFWDGSLSSHRWNVYLVHLHFRSSVVGQMILELWQPSF